MMRALLLPPMVLACVACVPSQTGSSGRGNEPLRVTNAGQPYQMSDGAAARRAADAECGPRGVRSSIYDRFDRATGEWVYPGGCV
jgi:hypothetical protein